MRISLSLCPQKIGAEEWLDSENGILRNRFFAKCLKTFDLSFEERIKNSVSALWNEFFYTCKSGIKNSIMLLKKNPYENLIPASERSGLVVFFHGLNGRPSVWNSYLEAYEKHNQDEVQLDLFAPTLPRLGHCGVEEETIEQIYSKVKEWASQNPGKPIVLYGQSNGSRFATHLEYLLREEFPNTPVYVSLTSAVLYGTSLVSSVARLFSSKIISTLTFGLVSEKTYEELSLGSESSKNLLKNARKPFEGERRYRMYAPCFDSLVKEKGSSLPRLSGENSIDEKHYLVTGCAHNSLVDKVCQKQITKTFHWMQKHTKEDFSKGNCKHYKNKKIVLEKVEKGVVVHDNRSLLKKVADCVKWVLNAIATLFRTVIRRLRKVSFPTPIENGGVVSYPKLNSEKSEGLYVFIHGLRSSPLQWDRYIKRVKKEHEYATIFAPEVYQKGNLSLDVAASPILEIIKQYLKDNPGKPIYLFGTSNGGRIVSYLENALSSDELGDSSLRVISVAGVHKGTKLINTLEKLHLDPLAGLEPTLKDEFKWESERANRLAKEWDEKQELWAQEQKDVRHFYCATLEDEMVWPIAGSLPNSSHTVSTHKIFSGQTHSSIVDHAYNKIFKWLERNPVL